MITVKTIGYKKNIQGNYKTKLKDHMVLKDGGPHEGNGI